jgi:hypothetical protein
MTRLASLLALSPILLLAGCGMGNTAAPITVPANSVTGVFMGGQQPVAGVSLQLYAVGTSGYGSAATPLFTPGSVLTTADGNFRLPSFTCPTPSSLVYLVGTGGQPIAAANGNPAVTNNNLAMMVGLGACSAVTSQFISVNEMTTVTSVWALAPFMTGIANIGSTSTNSLGISNAFAAINKMVNTANGAVSGPALPSNATLPTQEINTLADILEQCINSSGGTAADTTDGETNGTGCGKLFYNAGTGSTSTTNDTITAAMQIAQNPARNVAKLNMLRSASPVFQPAFSVNTPPTDWTIAISYTGGGLNSPRGVATDQSGNVWVANSGNSSVSEFSSVGSALSSSTGFTAGAINVPYAIAVDPTGDVWVANSGNNTVTKLTSGTAGTNYSGNSLNLPKGISIDGVGNVFLSDSGASTVSAFTSAGGTLAGSPFSPSGVSTPIGVVVSPR